MSNAIEFSAPGKAVTIEATPVCGGARFVVVDRGPGISDEDQARLFAKFQRLDGSDARAKSGTGSGLAISRAIVEQHGGAIDVTSELGVGSTFHFEIPTAIAPRRASSVSRRV